MFWRADLCAASVFDMELHVFWCFSMHGVLEHVHVLHQCFPSTLPCQVLLFVLKVHRPNLTSLMIA